MNIAFFGSKNVGFQCLKILNDFCSSNQEHNLELVLTNSRGDQIKDYCEINKIRTINSLNEYLDVDEIDLLISVQYHEILEKKHIDNSTIAVNLHMAPLPEYRGCNQFTHAILQSKSEFGSTIHILDQGIDSGDILFETRFPISREIWVSELYDLTVDRSIELFATSLPKLLSGDYLRIPQKDLVSERGTMIGFRRDIEKLKNIKYFTDPSDFEKQIRATSMPGFSPPYIKVGKRKVDLLVESFTGND